MAKKVLKYSADNINKLLDKINELDVTNITGKAPTLSIGTVTTLPAGSSATAVLTPSGIDAYRIDLGIPKGDTGQDGVKGADGVTPTFKLGTVSTLAPTDSATVTITKSPTTEEYTFDFGIPKGADGAKGADGINGTNGADGLDGRDGRDAVNPNFTVGIVTELEIGNTPTVTISGTYPNLVLNFGLPTKQPEFMWYGRLTLDEVGGSPIKYNKITAQMITTGANVKKVRPQIMGKTRFAKEVDTNTYDHLIIVVPVSKRYTVTKDNGFGGKVPFDETLFGSENGTPININGVDYLLYGEALTSPSEIFFYID